MHNMALVYKMNSAEINGMWKVTIYKMCKAYSSHLCNNAMQWSMMWGFTLL